MSFSNASIDDNLRQFVILQTGVQNPSNAFVQEFLMGRHAAGYRANWDTEARNRKSSRSSNDSHMSIDTTSVQHRSPDYRVEILAGLNPKSTEAKKLVQAMLKMENPSQETITKAMYDARAKHPRFRRSSAPSPEPQDRKTIDHSIKVNDDIFLCQCIRDNLPASHPCPHIDGNVTVFDHDPNVNYMASGALRPGEAGPNVPDDDASDCKDHWDAMTKYQPNAVVDYKWIVQEGYFAKMPRVLASLPQDYHTTITGLMGADRELKGVRRGDPVEHQDKVLAALMRRGGRPADPNAKVVYAEMLEAFFGPRDARHDAEFWATIEQMRLENSKSGIGDLLAWAGKK